MAVIHSSSETRVLSRLKLVIETYARGGPRENPRLIAISPLRGLPSGQSRGGSLDDFRSRVPRVLSAFNWYRLNVYSLSLSLSLSIYPLRRPFEALGSPRLRILGGSTVD